jgi:predicted transcriptional regulator
MEVEKNNIYKLELLKHVEETPLLNNRMAATKLGCSVKLAHELLSKMVDKGLFHVKKHHARRWDYFLTPKGIAEKARLTYEFLDFSMHFYREARKRSSQLCKDLAGEGIKKIAFIGAGDLAEIVYLGVKEWNLELIRVYADTEKENFMGVKIQSYPDFNIQHSTFNIQHFIVCLYDKDNPTKKNKFIPEEIIKNRNHKTEIINQMNFHWVF